MISPVRAMMLLVASMALTGANVPIAKVLATTMPAEVLLVLRFAIASAVLALLVPHEVGPRLSSLGLKAWIRVCLLAIVGSVLFTWAILAGVQRTSGVTAGIILSALPAVVALASVLLGSRLGRGQMAMVGLAVVGLGLVQVPAGSTGGDTIIGNLLIGLAVICEASFVILAATVSRAAKPLRLSLAVSLISLAVCLPFAVPSFADIGMAAIPIHVWGLLCWYALTASALCTVLWYRGAAHVEPWAAGLATAAVPISAMVVSVAALGERITAIQLAGAALVVAAISVGMLAQRRQSKQA